MSAIARPRTDYYGPDLQAQFEPIAVDELQGGDIIPSHDGLYHLYEGHVEREDGTVEVNFTRCRYANGSGESYSVEFTPGHIIYVLA